MTLERSTNHNTRNEPVLGPALNREQLLDRLAIEQSTKKDLLYASTPHFIVVYKGIPSVYRNFGSYLDTHPLSLGTFLETGVSILSKRFDIIDTDTSQVVTVRNRRVAISDLSTKGYHSWGIAHDFGGGRSDSLTFNTLFPTSPDDIGGNYPDFFPPAAHEVLGHGFFQRKVTPDLYEEGMSGGRYVPVLAEGVPEYINHFLTGVNSHTACATLLVERAEWLWGYPSFSHDVDKDILIKHIEPSIQQQKHFLSRITIPDTFVFTEANESRNSEVAMSRGASFIKFITDNFGDKALKGWIEGGNINNFMPLIEEITGRTLVDLQSEWKKAVKDKFAKVIEKDKKQGLVLKSRIERRQMAVELLEKYT